MSIVTHIPAIQVLLPLFVGLINVLSFNLSLVRILSVVTILVCLIISIYMLPAVKSSIYYSFGGWPAPIGIEYRLDYLNQPLIIYMNMILLFFLVFGKRLIETTITCYIKEEKRHIFYTLLLLSHFGYLGIMSTNDLFNMYVFLEISSLSTYVLVSISKNPKSYIGAFDYLMLGTIGATLILISIGFLLAITGSLNISDIFLILPNQVQYYRIITTAVVFFLVGAILKIAFFPMHFWMIRAYSTTAPFMLTYLAAISGVMGCYIMIRFLHFTIEISYANLIIMMLRPMAMATIVLCAFLALISKNFKKVVIYSSASQVGYAVLLITIEQARSILFQLLIFEGINKVAMFLIIAIIEHYSNEKGKNLNFDNFIIIRKSYLFKLLYSFIIIFSASIPLTSMFLVKIKILNLLINNTLFIELVVILIGSCIALLYHGKLIMAVFFSTNYSTKKNTEIVIIDKVEYGLVAIVIIQFLMLVFIKDFSALIGYIE